MTSNQDATSFGNFDKIFITKNKDSIFYRTQVCMDTMIIQYEIKCDNTITQKWLF